MESCGDRRRTEIFSRYNGLGRLNDQLCGRVCLALEWFNFGAPAFASNPSVFVYSTGTFELPNFICLIFGFLRKITYTASFFLGVVIWSVPEVLTELALGTLAQESCTRSLLIPTVDECGFWTKQIFAWFFHRTEDQVVEKASRDSKFLSGFCHKLALAIRTLIRPKKGNSQNIIEFKGSK